MKTLEIRNERINKGWSLEYVGNSIGVSKSYIHDIETGRRKPSYDVLCKLEDLFKLNHRQLFAVNDESNSLSKEE